MEFPVTLNPQGSTPLYQQLANGIEHAIANGCLKPGDLLPGTHTLASSHGISRATVVHAYNELISRKFIKTMRGVGTMVSPEVSSLRERDTLAHKADFALSAFGRRMEQLSSTAVLTSGDMPGLNFGGGDGDLLPTKIWQRLLSNSCDQHFGFEPYIKNEPLGFQALREAVSNYLRRQRSVRCTADIVGVFPESLFALGMTAKLLIDPGTVVAMEEPGFPYARRVFKAHGANLELLPVDRDGLITSNLDRVSDQCKIIYVSPSHQDPTGGVLSLERRQELLRWAERRNVVVIEDDYDCEFRYGGTTLPSLHGLDQSERVVHIYSFWKVLAPLSTVGTVVLPTKMVEPFRRAVLSGGSNFPNIEQFTLTAFLNEGHLERHLRRSKAIYAQRWRSLVKCLTYHLSRSITINRESSGTHQLIRLATDLSDAEVLRLAEESGLPMVTTAPYYFGDSPRSEFLIAFAHIHEEQMEQAVESFAKRLNAHASGEDAA